jgi:hypothetical protein
MLIKDGQTRIWKALEKDWFPSSAILRTVNVDDYGAKGDGVTDDSVSINSAINELNAMGGGTLVFTPGEVYVASELLPKSNILININRATLRAKTTVGNILFRITNSVISTKTLSSAVRFATSITVSSTSGISVGDAVIVSAGTWTGSGVEHGPCEWNIVKTITDSTHLVLKTPLKYSYTAMGMTGASPILQVFGPYNSLIKHVRITNGFIDVNGTDNPLFFGVLNTQHVEIDHITMLAKGSIPLLINYTADLKFHHNVGIGPSKDADVFCTSAGLMESSISDNWINFEQATGGGKENSFVCEVMTRDCEFARNTIFGIDATNGAVIGLNMTFGAFNDRFVDNRIFGINLSNSFEDWGIRTYENAGNATMFGANIYSRNILTNLLYGIGDKQTGTIIDGNEHLNDTVVSFSGFLTSDNDLAQVGANYLKNIATPSRDSSSNPIRTQLLPGGDLGFIWGNGSPESVVIAPIGMTYLRRDGGAGTILYVKESGTGNTGWIAYGGVGTFQPLDSDLTAIAVLSPSNGDFIERVSGAWANRTSAQVKSDLAINFTDLLGTASRAQMPAPISARVYNSVDISIADSTVTTLTFDSERWDSDTIHSILTNTSRLVATTAGLYDIGAAIEFESNATGFRYVALRINGTTVPAIDTRPAVNGFGTRVSLTTTCNLAANDFVEVAVFHTSGVSLKVLASPNWSPEFWMTRLDAQP